MRRSLAAPIIEYGDGEGMVTPKAMTKFIPNMWGWSE